jgi:hypothetical protein
MTRQLGQPNPTVMPILVSTTAFGITVSHTPNVTENLSGVGRGSVA